MVMRHARTALGIVALATATGCQLIADIQDLPGPPGSSAQDSGAAWGATVPFDAAGPVAIANDAGANNAADGGSSSSGEGGAADASTSVCIPASHSGWGGGGPGGWPGGGGPGDAGGSTGAVVCYDAPLLPGGSFFRDYDGKDFTNSNLRATVSPFRLDRYEITLGQFRPFVAAYYSGWRPQPGDGQNPNGTADSGWHSEWSPNLPADGMSLEASLACNSTLQTYTSTAGATETQPLNCASWYVAFAFCIWDGGRLPTDSEWEFAAAGGGEQRYYPWNDVIDDSHASYFVDSTKQCFGDHLNGCAITDISAGGTHSPGAGKWGQEDLAGNLAEWVRDGDGSTNSDCVDCYDPTGQSGVRRVRGGAFNSTAPGDLRVAAYTTFDPGTPSEQIGFRCARPQ
jgi:sulfatase modifying factor 1